MVQAPEWYNESGVAEAFAKLDRQQWNQLPDVVVMTKVHPRSYNFNAMDHALRESRKLLQAGSRERNALDVVLLHTPWCWEGQFTAAQNKISWQTAWTNLEKLRAEPDHSITSIGVSNFHLELLEDLVLRHANSKVAVVQNWMDPFHQDAAVRAFAKEHKIQYMAYSSFGTQWNRLPNPVFADPVLNSIA